MESILKEILTEGLDDWVPIDQVLWLARQEATETGVASEQVTVDVLRRLMAQGLAVVGQIGDQGFEGWTGSEDEIIARVVESLDAVDWNPQGGGFWLASTPVGNDWVRSRL
jgi:hypothetical protein